MQLHGIDVIAVPTTLLSNRPGYPTLRGRVLEAELVADLLAWNRGARRGERASMILSGYLGSAAIAEVVAGFVARAKARNGALRYTLDPVLGDRDRGLFVKADIPPVVRDRLLPLADIITPNHFEFEWLCGAEARTQDQVLAQARGLIARGPDTVVITSAELEGTPADQIETLASNARVPFGYARRGCRSARTGPAISSPRCSPPRAFWSGDARGTGACVVRDISGAGAHASCRHRGDAHRRERGRTRASDAPFRGGRGLVGRISVSVIRP